MSDNNPMAQKTKGALSLFSLAAVFVLLVLLSNTFLKGMRLDLTENGLYSVSAGTEEILAAIDQPLTLRFFFSDQATRKIPGTRIYANRVREMLEEYVQRSAGMIELQIIDPLPYSEEEDLAANYGLQAMQGGRGSGAVYFGLVGTNDFDDVIIIPAFHRRNEQFLEYDLSKLIYTLSHPQRAVIGLLSELPLAGGWNPGTRSPEQPWAMYAAISEMFEIRALPKDSLEIAPDIDVLMLVHPKQLPTATLYAIDQFILARLESKSIQPSPQADRYTLIKRLYYDLLGLPPTPAQVDAFVSDQSAQAYAQLDDRLLKSPHFGDR